MFPSVLDSLLESELHIRTETAAFSIEGTILWWASGAERDDSILPLTDPLVSSARCILRPIRPPWPYSRRHCTDTLQLASWSSEIPRFLTRFPSCYWKMYLVNIDQPRFNIVHPIGRTSFTPIFEDPTLVLYHKGIKVTVFLNLISTISSESTDAM